MAKTTGKCLALDGSIDRGGPPPRKETNHGPTPERGIRGEGGEEGERRVAASNSLMAQFKKRRRHRLGKSRNSWKGGA